MGDNVMVSNTYKASYSELIEAVKNYYGSGSDQWVKVATHTATPKELASILKQAPNVNTTVNLKGEIVSWDYELPYYNKSTSTITNIGEYTDSNLIPATQGTSNLTTIKIPSQTGTIIDGEFTEVPMTSNLTKYESGIKTTTQTQAVSGSVTGGIIAAASAIQLGLGITGKLYDKYPDFFEDNNLQILAPQAWEEIASSGTSFGNVINTLFFNSPEKHLSQWYVPEESFAYMALYLQQSEALKQNLIVNSRPSDFPSDVDKYLPFNITTNPLLGIKHNTSTIIDVISVDTSFEHIAAWLYYSTNDFRTWFVGYTADGSADYKFDNKSVHTILGSSGGGIGYDSIIGTYNETDSSGSTAPRSNTTRNHLAWLALYYNTLASKYDGIDKQSSATIPDLSLATTVDEMLDLLKSIYSDLWNERIENTVLQDDGTTKTIVYIPMPFPTGGTENQITTEGATQNSYTISADLDGEDDSDIKTATIIQIMTGDSSKGMTNTITPTTTPNPPDTGDGDTPVIIPSIGTATALWSIYNPTLTQVKSLGSYLWSADFVDQLIKLFTNPMEAVISLHKVFGTPTIDGTGNIKIGYLNTGVSDVKLVSEQYISVDCGSIDLPEYFGNVFDYAPYTEISLYLPFIGIIRLNTADVVRSTISITYKIDVLTGTCLAQINVKRDGSGGILYQYTGNCCVEYPLSSGSYLGILSSALGVATGAVTGASIGGIGGALLGGATKALHTSGASYERSGAFSGNAGAMGIKKPYLIIIRPQTNIANNVGTLQGFPTNTYTALSACSGYTVVKACNVDTIANATNREKELISSALKNGIIIK